MKKQDFLRRLEEELAQPTGSLHDSVLLADIKAWDSIGKMAILTIIDGELGVEVPSGGLQKCATVGDVIRLAGVTD